jgi:hypothetical protein
MEGSSAPFIDYVHVRPFLRDKSDQEQSSQAWRMSTYFYEEIDDAECSVLG